MTIDPATLPASRETDCKVAEILGWTDLKWFREMDNTDGYAGIQPGGEKHKRVPLFSTTDAALTALVEWQRRTGLIVKIEAYPPGFDKDLWSVFCGDTDVTAPTIYHAICRLICAIEQEK